MVDGRDHWYDELMASADPSCPAEVTITCGPELRITAKSDFVDLSWLRPFGLDVRPKRPGRR